MTRRRLQTPSALFLAAILGLASSTTLLAATPAPPIHVTATILADADALVPGKEITVGVLLTIDPGWHIYWLNPGDSGGPTSVHFSTPDGFQTGPLVWPVPQSFRDAELTTYGYTDKVLLWTTLRVPETLEAKGKLTISADVSWLVCKEVCLPGKSTVTLDLPVAATSKPANAELFAAWKPKAPIDAATPDSPATAGVRGELTPDHSAGRFTIQLDWKNPPANLEIFPAADLNLIVEKIDAQTKDRTTTVTLRLKLLAPRRAEPGTLPVVIAFTDEKGIRRGVSVLVPLAAPPR